MSVNENIPGLISCILLSRRHSKIKKVSYFSLKLTNRHDLEISGLIAKNISISGSKMNRV